MNVDDYAWNWFKYHAEQRLTAFRFYLVFLGLLVLGFSTGFEHSNAGYVKIVGGFGAFISIVFLILEIRNEKLMSIGRNALEQLELKFEDPMASELRLCYQSKNSNPLASHKIWLKVIYIVCTLGFIYGFFKPDLFF